MPMPTPCEDCVTLHGDTASDWLKKWPMGADWWPSYAAYLCDGCQGERQDAEDLFNEDLFNDFNWVGSRHHY